MTSQSMPDVQRGRSTAPGQAPALLWDGLVTKARLRRLEVRELAGVRIEPREFHRRRTTINPRLSSRWLNGEFCSGLDEVLKRSTGVAAPRAKMGQKDM